MHTVPRLSVSPLRLPPLRLPPGVAVGVATEPEPGLLSPAERARLESFASADRRHAFVLGRTAARTLLGEALGLAPEHVVLDVAESGALVVPGYGVPGYGVSVAHTGRGAGAVGVAAVARRPVGIDAETVAARRPDLWRRLLSPAEHGALEALGGPTDDAQTLLWALKESVLKGQQTGLRAGARSVVLGVPKDGRVRAVSDQSGAWDVAYARFGAAVVAVAWQESEDSLRFKD